MSTHAKILAIMMLIAAAAGSWSRWHESPVAVAVSRTTLPADGYSWANVTLHREHGAIRADLVRADVAPKHYARVEVTQVNDQTVGVRTVTSVLPGDFRLTLKVANQELSAVKFNSTPLESDRFSDGTPDFARLSDPTDRNAFREWFTAIAEWQSLKPKSDLPKQISDCSALLRFAYSNALRQHDSAWLLGQGMAQFQAPPDVRRYQFPYTPLGPRVFRVKPGAYSAADASQDAFSEFADAENLLQLNTHLVGRDLSSAKPGDLLFYRQLSQHSPFHSMVFVGRSHFSADAETNPVSIADEIVVYHTGPTATDAGEMRRVQARALLQHPDPRWRPVPGNSNFLGVYRWNILREAN